MNMLLPAKPSKAFGAPNKAAYESMRSETASLLSHLMTQPIHGRRVELFLSRILPPGLVTAIHDGPGKQTPSHLCFLTLIPGEAVVGILGQEWETPERIWTRKMAKSTAEELQSLTTQCRTAQVNKNLPPFDVNSRFRVKAQ